MVPYIKNGRSRLKMWM